MEIGDLIRTKNMGSSMWCYCIVTKTKPFGFHRLFGYSRYPEDLYIMDDFEKISHRTLKKVWKQWRS